MQSSTKISAPPLPSRIKQPSIIKCSNNDNKNYIDNFCETFPKWTSQNLNDWSGSHDIKNKLRHWITTRTETAFPPKHKFIGLFSGPTGSGKSCLLRLLCNELNLKPIILDGIHDNGYGMDNVSGSVAQFHKAKGCVIILDHIESFHKERIQDLCYWARKYEKRVSLVSGFPPIIATTSLAVESLPRDTKAVKQVSDTFVLPARTYEQLEQIAFDIVMKERFILDATSVPTMIQSTNGNIFQLFINLEMCQSISPTQTHAAVTVAPNSYLDHNPTESERIHNVFAATSYVLHVNNTNQMNTKTTSQIFQDQIKYTVCHDPLLTFMVWENFPNRLRDMPACDPSRLKRLTNHQLQIVKEELKQQCNHLQLLANASNSFSYNDVWASTCFQIGQGDTSMKTMSSNEAVASFDETQAEDNNDDFISEINAWANIVETTHFINHINSEKQQRVFKLDYPDTLLKLHSKQLEYKRKQAKQIETWEQPPLSLSGCNCLDYQLMESLMPNQSAENITQSNKVQPKSNCAKQKKRKR